MREHPHAVLNLSSVLDSSMQNMPFQQLTSKGLSIKDKHGAHEKHVLYIPACVWICWLFLADTLEKESYILYRMNLQ